MSLLAIEELGDYIDSRFTRDLFRLELHQELHVGSDGDDFARYLAGEPAPEHRPWSDVIRREVAEGKFTRRVLVLDEPLTDYRRFSIEWSYLDNVRAGERCVVLPSRRGVDLGDRDFWMIDNRAVVVMHYDPDGRFVGGEPTEDPAEVARWRDVAERAWSAGDSLTEWWAAHPQYWRDRVPTPRSKSDTQTHRTPDPARSDAPSAAH